MPRRYTQTGHTLIELVISMAIAALLLTGLQQVLSSGFNSSEDIQNRTDLARQARFATERIVSAVRSSERLLIPLADNPNSTFQENIREQTVPASGPPSGSILGTAVLAITLDPTQDIDGDGVADADNDGDGRIDEDLPADSHNDGKAGVRDFDDDGNGIKDFFFSPSGDDDESSNRAQSEDPINGVDDDDDGTIDEDPSADNNGDGAPGVSGVDDDGDGSIDEGDVADDDEDGRVDEDWYDVVAFYLDGSSLIERRAIPWDENGDGAINGRDYVESTLADNVALLRFERIATIASSEHTLLKVTITLADANGETISVNTHVRLGASR